MLAREEVLEYRLGLRTGEEILVAELDPGRTPTAADPAVLAAVADLIARCTRVPRDELDAAKKGDTRPLEGRLGTPPRGCLIKALLTCSEIRHCTSADRKLCRTDAWSTKEKRACFPLCWQAPVPEGLSPETALGAVAIATAIVHAWREGHYVFIVDG